MQQVKLSSILLPSGELLENIEKKYGSIEKFDAAAAPYLDSENSNAMETALMDKIRSVSNDPDSVITMIWCDLATVVHSVSPTDEVINLTGRGLHNGYSLYATEEMNWHAKEFGIARAEFALIQLELLANYQREGRLSYGETVMTWEGVEFSNGAILAARNLLESETLRSRSYEALTNGGNSSIINSVYKTICKSAPWMAASVGDAYDHVTSLEDLPARYRALIELAHNQMS